MLLDDLLLKKKQWLVHITGPLDFWLECSKTMLIGEDWRFYISNEHDRHNFPWTKKGFGTSSSLTVWWNQCRLASLKAKAKDDGSF